MARLDLFADEAGNFDFSRGQGASRYFVLTTVVFPNGHHAVAEALRALRFELAWDGVDLEREFHATDDKQAVRDRVYEVLGRHEYRVDATILDKPKARPRIRSSDERFYESAWFFHLTNVLPHILAPEDELHVIAASVGTRRKRDGFFRAVRSAVTGASGARAQAAYWPAAADLCLQAADYLAWAIQRKWERGDSRSYDLIADRIGLEHDLFYRGTTEYY